MVWVSVVLTSTGRTCLGTTASTGAATPLPRRTPPRVQTRKHHARRSHASSATRQRNPTERLLGLPPRRGDLVWITGVEPLLARGLDLGALVGDLRQLVRVPLRDVLSVDEFRRVHQLIEAASYANTASDFTRSRPAGFPSAPAGFPSRVTIAFDVARTYRTPWHRSH
jgi:hypothetical protein